MLFSEKTKTFEELEQELLSDIVDVDLFDPSKALALQHKTSFVQRHSYFSSLLSGIGKVAKPLGYALLAGGFAAASGCISSDTLDNASSVQIDEINLIETVGNGIPLPIRECNDQMYSQGGYILVKYTVEDKDGIELIIPAMAHPRPEFKDSYGVMLPPPSSSFPEGEKEYKGRMGIAMDNYLGSKYDEQWDVLFLVKDSRGNTDYHILPVPFRIVNGEDSKIPC